jgi:hypothetical protein
VKLENGTTAHFKLSDELSIPTDPILIHKEALRAPARFAFWAYQTERALAEVRKQERCLTEEEGKMNLGYRKWIKDDTDDMPTEAMVKARVDSDREINSMKIHLNAARKQYSLLRATRDSVDHRVYVLRALVAQKPERQ